MESPNADFSFRPITQGLGFHPFSDGLPYAPLRKPERLHMPPRPDSLQSQIPVKEAVAPRFHIEVFGFSYLLKRVFAFAIDTMISFALYTGAAALLLWGKLPSAELFTNPAVFIVAGAFFVVFNWVLITAQELAIGSSVGKLVFNLSLRAGGLRVLLRAMGFVLSSMFFGLGLIWAIFDPKRRCFHDILAGTQPDELARL